MKNIVVVIGADNVGKNTLIRLLNSIKSIFIPSIIFNRTSTIISEMKKYNLNLRDAIKIYNAQKNKNKFNIDENGINYAFVKNIDNSNILLKYSGLNSPKYKLSKDINILYDSYTLKFIKVKRNLIISLFASIGEYLSYDKKDLNTILNEFRTECNDNVIDNNDKYADLILEHTDILNNPYETREIILKSNIFINIDKNLPKINFNKYNTPYNKYITIYEKEMMQKFMNKYDFKKLYYELVEEYRDKCNKIEKFDHVFNK